MLPICRQEGVALIAFFIADWYQNGKISKRTEF